MNGGNKAFVLVTLAMIGIWGCTQGPAKRPGSAEQIKALETRLAKLEEDFRTATTARDQLRQRAASLEREKGRVQQERDELRRLVTTRTTERDSLQTQYDQFRKSIRELLGQAETAASGSPAGTAGAAATGPGSDE